MKERRRTYDISTIFWAIQDLTDPGFLDQVLALVARYRDEFGARGYSLSQANTPRYKPVDRDYLLREVWKVDPSTKKCPAVRFGGGPPYQFDLRLDVDRNAGQILRNRYLFSELSVSINRTYFAEVSGGERQHRVGMYLKCCRELYLLSRPLCGHGHEADDRLAISAALGRGFRRWLGFVRSVEFAHIDQPHLDCPLAGAYWANYLGSSCVAYFGAERLKRALGVVNRETLEDGGVVLLTAEDPLTPDDPTARANQLALWRDLGLRPIPDLKIIARYKTGDPWARTPPAP